MLLTVGFKYNIQVHINPGPSCHSNVVTIGDTVSRDTLFLPVVFFLETMGGNMSSSTLVFRRTLAVSTSSCSNISMGVDCAICKRSSKTCHALDFHTISISL